MKEGDGGQRCTKEHEGGSRRVKEGDGGQRRATVKALRYSTAVRHCTTALSYGTELRHCATALRYGTALLHTVLPVLRRRYCAAGTAACHTTVSVPSLPGTISSWQFAQCTAAGLVFSA